MSFRAGRYDIRPMLRPGTFAAALALTAAAGIAACGGNPTRPTPPVDLPEVTCPAPVSTQSPDGAPLEINYSPATAAGGILPVTVSCAPESGSTFPIGSTEVTCTATDAGERTDSCTFSVTVTVPPRISATKFVAFGDSITVGELSFGRWLLVARPQASYPASLLDLLQGRYTAQSFVLTNAGLGGERVASDSGQARFRSTLLEARPEVVLLMEGVNDLNALREDAYNDIIFGLRSMIDEAQELGARVFLGTLLPQRPGGSRAYAYELVPEINDQIRGLAASEGVDLVDLYAGFGGTAGTFIGDDGLHPTTAGYEKIAEIFFEALREKLEVPPMVPSPTSLWRGGRSPGAY
jgi:lysophospholipase L1-like esterase